jgi:lysozyme
MLEGIDISHYQGTPNFDLVKSAKQFVFAQSSYGNGYVDPQFTRNASELRRVGMLRGYYHYAYPEYNSAQDEADWFCKVVGKPQAGELMWLDFEEQYSDDKVAWVKAFLDRVKSNIGYTGGIYMELSWFTDSKLNWKPVADAGYWAFPAWFNYDPNNNNFDIPAWSEAAFRQYANNLKVNGINTVVDGDVFFGDATAFQKYGFQAPVVIDYQALCKEIKDEIGNMDNDNVKVIKIRNLVANV